MRILTTALLTAASCAAQLVNPGTTGSAVTYGTTAGTAAQGNDSRITGAAQTANNLSDLANKATALANLGGQPIYATYYVDNVAGSDSNNGTSPATPWATIAKVNSATLTAGQTVAFRSGDVWHETLTVAQSGSSVAPITYSSYGGGAQPVITASDTVTGWTQSGSVWSKGQSTNPGLVNFGGQPGTLVGSLVAVAGPNQFYWNGSSSLSVYSLVDPSPILEVATRAAAVTSSGASYITITGLEIRGGTVNNLFCGVAVACSSWKIQNNYFNSSYSAAINFAFNNGVQTSGNLIDGNVFRGAGSSPIGFGNGGTSQGLVITNNDMANVCQIFVNGSSANAYCDGVQVFSQTQSDSGYYIAYNRVQNSGQSGVANYGGGFHCDTVTNCVIEHNVAINTSNPGVNMEKVLTGAARYNLVSNGATSQYVGGLYTSSGGGYNLSNVIVEYNTSYSGWWPCAGGQASGGGSISNLTFRKNTCSNANPSSGSNIYWDASVTGSGNSFTTNGLGLAGSCFINVANTCYNTYAGSPASITSNALQGNPTFTSALLADFTQAASSPTLSIGAFPFLVSGTPFFAPMPSIGQQQSDPYGSAQKVQESLATSATIDTTNASNISSGTLNHGRLPALTSTDIPNNASNTTGNAATATTATTASNSTALNGGIVPLSASFIGTNASGQIIAKSITAAQVSILTSGTAATYTTPTGALYLIVEGCGGGGGGGGSGTSGGTGSAGTSTTFGTLTGGAGSAGSGGNGGAGGSASGGDLNMPGQSGYPTISGYTYFAGPSGGMSYFGGAGGSVQGGGNAGAAAATNSCSGGGGASDAGTAPIGTSGGAGGYFRKLISSPSSTYTYTVGTGGSGGVAGTSGNLGGNGAAGIILVTAYSQ